MVLTISKAMRDTVFLLLVYLLVTINSAAVAQSNLSGNAGAKNPNWVLDAAKVPFSKTPLHGQIDGIDFKPTAEKIYDHERIGGGAKVGEMIGVAKISFKDAGGRQIDVTIYDCDKDEDVMFSQTALLKLKGASAMTVANGLHNLGADQFGIRISLGKISTGKLQPVYIIFREDRDNWMEGYVYAKVHGPVFF